MIAHYKFQIHKYRNGHQLVSSAIDLERQDQDTVDRLSDISGQIRPGEKFAPYFTCYPLPSTKYFVVARSWQDLNAPRTGCVVTKSLIIDIEEWKTNDNVTEYFHGLFEGIDDEGVPPEQLTTSEITAAVFASNVNELVEALFLEQRKPVVVFNSQEADKIAVRLYSVLWPAIRSVFACCTFALSPRTVSARPFDLLFSPSEIKARFSEWDGRRVEGSITTKPARHRWTNDLVNRIFRAPVATLFDPNTRSLFHLDVAGDDNGLRLSLLWNELLLKVQDESSPMAILGLLDIVNSQPVFANNLYSNLRPYIENAIAAAKYKLTPEEAWKFYVSLLAKHRRKLMSRSMITSVRLSCSELTALKPDVSVQLLKSTGEPSVKIPSVLIAAIGDGLANLPADRRDIALSNISPSAVLQLVGSSKQLANSIMEGPFSEIANHISNELVVTSDKTVRRKAVMALSPLIRDDEHAIILEAILSDSDVQLFRKVASDIGNNSSFNNLTLNQIVIDAAAQLRQLDYLIELIYGFNNEALSVDLFVKIISKDPNLIGWFVLVSKTDNLIKERTLKILLTKPELVENFLAHDSKLSSATLQIILQNNRSINVAIGNFLLFADLKTEVTLPILNNLDVNQLRALDKQYFSQYLSKAFASLSGNDLRDFALFISKLPASLDIDYVEAAVRNVRDRIKIVDNLATLLDSGPEVFSALAGDVDFISRILADNLEEKVDNTLANKWMQLIATSKSQERKLRAAATVVDFAYGRKSYDPTYLLTETFPLLYKSFLKGSNAPVWLPFLFFTDWDKCKKMRFDLAARYISSKWPPLGLIDVAAATGIVSEILLILLDMKGGKRFVKDLVSQARNERIPESHPLMQEVHKIFKFK